MSGYTRPSSLDAAYAARAAHPDWVVLAGGTDLMVGVLHRPAPPGVIDLFGLAPLRGIEVTGDCFRIGAATTYAELLRHEVVAAELPLLRACAEEVGALQIQERGTIGGNVATSSPVGDTLPALLALDAEVVLGSAQGPRRVPYHSFCTGYRKVDLRPDELIVAFELPRPAPPHQHWRKVGTRKAQSISKVMLAASARDAGDALQDVRVAMGAVADRPVRLRGVEALLEGQVPDAALAEAARAQVAREITPISDVRSTAPYRLRVAQNLVARFVLELAGGA
ncbi:MAG: xanthine dehydrogenase family protein subunit M [Planctomycetota bacterium]